MHEVACILCDKRSDDIAITEKGFTGRKCLGCQLIFISPRPSAEEISNLYSHDHAAQYADAQFRFDGFKRMAAGATLSKIAKYRSRGSLLELGPGGGAFLQEARKRGYEPYGIELNPIEARWISENLDIPCESVGLEEGTFRGKHFSIIYHADVLSHLHDPVGTFEHMNSVLDNDGLVVFETGNIGDLDSKYYKYYAQFLYPDHLFFFGESSIRALLDRTGFECLHIYREAIMLQLLLQKALWRLKDSLKDKRVVEEMSSSNKVSSPGRNLSVKRQVRLFYRYVSYYLVKCGGMLPKEGRPLKLLVVAKKKVQMRRSG